MSPAGPTSAIWLGVRFLTAIARSARLEDVEFGAGEAPLLIVRGKQKTPYEIPFAEAYLAKVDLAAKQIRMRLPDGMLEMNAPLTEEEKQEQKSASEAE